jgi:hypothetical protein
MIGGINISGQNVSFFETVNKLLENNTCKTRFGATITVLFSSKSNIIAKLNANANTTKTDLNKIDITVANHSDFGKLTNPNLPTIKSIEDANPSQNELLAKYMSETETTIKDMSKNPQNIDTKALFETIQSLATITKNIVDVAIPYVGDKSNTITLMKAAGLTHYAMFINNIRSDIDGIISKLPESAKTNEAFSENFEEFKKMTNQLSFLREDFNIKLNPSNSKYTPN